LKDIKDHTLKIIRDDGVYRHVKGSANGSYHYSFEIITWPGWLCYTGDMGSYTFQRLEDMFEFFRMKSPRVTDDRLQINPGYWAEKVQAADKHGKIEEFSAERFRARLLEDIDERDDENAEQIKTALTEEVLNYLDEQDEAEARKRADSFEFNGKQVFHDLWDYDFRAYTHHFIWCCYALAWTIREYDALKAASVEETKEVAA
jgi:hypothetical protein